jgi:hypothetical protein
VSRYHGHLTFAVPHKVLLKYRDHPPDTGLMTAGKPTAAAAGATSACMLMRALRGVGRPAAAKQVRVAYCSVGQTSTAVHGQYVMQY